MNETSRSAPVIVIGELALHAFVPSGEAQITPNDPRLELGGGIGMMARHLAERGCAARAFTITGDDDVGLLLRSMMSRVAPASVHVVDSNARSSLIYMYYGTVLDRLGISAGNVSPGLLLEAVRTLPSDAWVYCPCFPGHEELCRAVVASSRRAVIDFGHFADLGDFDRLVRRLESVPAGHIAQLNGASLDEAARRELLAMARGHGSERAFVTCGGEPILAADANRVFSVVPEPTDPKCTIGAGDVLIAETMFQLRSGDDFQTALALGSRAASAKCRRWGI